MTEKTNMPIPNIKMIRRYKQMTQRDLAEALGVDTSVISKYESGKISPSYDRLEEISKVLGVRIDTLFSDAEDLLMYDCQRMTVSTKEPKYLQMFELHMKNGEVLEYAEEYDLPTEEGIIGDFKRGKKKFLEFGDHLVGYTVPLDQISFIVTSGVKKVV